MTTMPLAARDEALAPVPPRADDVERDLLATLEPLGMRGRAWIAGLAVVVLAAAVAYVYQLAQGLRVTDMRNLVSWGTYMTDFVFFIGISHAGTLISAILRVTDAGWRRPITRMAEAITVFALLVGGSMVVIDMGRPDRLWELVTSGRLQSPIMWDLVSVLTYITGSLLYLYVAMIPDMPILARAARARGRSPRLVRLYEALALGYRETPEHRRRLARALGAMAVIIIPVAVSVHSVVSWVFGMTLRPGWHSTVFAPYFVIGAIYSGTAAIITAMALFRRAYHLERYLLPDHFRKLATLLVALTLLYGYFTLSDYLTAWYGREAVDTRLLARLAGVGGFGPTFWGWLIVGFFVPLALLVFPSRRSLASIVTASVLINVGMWLERYLIVVPTLETPFLPAHDAGFTIHYFPSVVELLITAGAFAAFMLLYTLFSRVFPILSIWETAEDAGDAPDAGAPARAHHHAARHRALPTVGVLLLAGAFGVLAPSRVARAQAPTAGATAAAAPAPGPGAAPVAAAAPAPAARVTITRRVEDGQNVLVAAVTSPTGQPIAGATVQFAVVRTFGELKLGSDQTLSDGTAATAFPAGLPGDSAGRLVVRASLQAPVALEGVTAEASLAGAAPAARLVPGVPRELWAARAPIPLVVTITLLAICVWGTYAFVVAQLVAMARLGQEN